MSQIEEKSVEPTTSSSTLKIKNMVCDRCIMVVDEVLRGQGFQVDDIQLGNAVVSPGPDAEGLARLEEDLKRKGFELVRERRDELATAIKSELINYLNLVESHQEKATKPPLLSAYLSGKLHRSYATLSRAFTASEGITIEKYLIRLRMERVKEMLSYDELTLSQIAWRLGFSSLQHLSGQFRQIVGMPVSEYRKRGAPFRRTLDSIG
jgi:AraC family transcriptional regulator